LKAAEIDVQICQADLVKGQRNSGQCTGLQARNSELAKALTQPRIDLTSSNKDLASKTQELESLADKTQCPNQAEPDQLVEKNVDLTQGNADLKDKLDNPSDSRLTASLDDLEPTKQSLDMNKQILAQSAKDLADCKSKVGNPKFCNNQCTEQIAREGSCPTVSDRLSECNTDKTELNKDKNDLEKGYFDMKKKLSDIKKRLGLKLFRA
jgi:predicted nuclease with TOPRIM domain